jgi:uncharacterized protein
MNSEMLCRIAPFILYMSFVAMEEVVGYLTGKGWYICPENSLLYLYPIKALSVGLLLVLYRKRFVEIRIGDILRPMVVVSALVTGIGIFFLWINLDFPSATMGTLRGYNPNLVQNAFAHSLLVVSRLAGAVLVVPVMEELFWRSFLIRYIISQDFTRVAIGRFTWPSFIITVVLFGLEHNLFLAGMAAGIAYNLVVYHTRSITACILAHSITNLALGIYVINSGKWHFW